MLGRKEACLRPGKQALGNICKAAECKTNATIDKLGATYYKEIQRHHPEQELHCRFLLDPRVLYEKRKQSEAAVMYHVVNLLRKVEILQHVAIKRGPILQRWTKGRDSRGRDPRPTLFQFANPRHRDGCSSASDRIKTTTWKGLPWNRTILLSAELGKKKGSPEFNAAWLKAVQTRTHERFDGVPLKTTP